MTDTGVAAPPAIRRQERFSRVPSTNDVVRGWLAAGEPEICLALADEQTAGRGRNGRSWTAPSGAGLLLSLGFRPTWLLPERAWRLAATVSLAMADAAEESAGLPDRSVQLKWPNDLVIATDPGLRALDPFAAEDAGSAAVCLPDGLGIRVTFEGVAASNDLSDRGLVRVGDAWETPGYATAAARITLAAKVNAGSLALDPARECAG